MSNVVSINRAITTDEIKRLSSRIDKTIIDAPREIGSQDDFKSDVDRLDAVTALVVDLIRAAEILGMNLPPQGGASESFSHIKTLDVLSGTLASVLTLMEGRKTLLMKEGGADY